MSAKKTFDPDLLIDLFDNSDLNFYLKSGIGITLSNARTTDISAWLKGRFLDRPF